MFTASLLLIAAFVLGKDWILERVRELSESGRLKRIDGRHLAAGALLVAAAVSWSWPASSAPDDGRPTPAPDAGRLLPLDLNGLFTGPTAAEDAAALAGLCDELGDYVQQDGMRDKPRLTNGWAVADLRSTARDIRMGGESIGNRQPKVRDAVARYLEQPGVVGKSGGSLGPKERSAWVTAFHDIRDAAEAAIKSEAASR